jgi:tRNA dimethylallyltransferase
VGEVRQLRARGDLHRSLPALRAVGYRQLWAYLEGEVTLEEATQRAVTASAQLAKRQLTWLKRELGYVTLSVPSMSAVGAQEALAKGILEAAGA